MESESESSAQTLTESLFNLNISEDEPENPKKEEDNNPLKTLLKPALSHYFNILDFSSIGHIGFSSFLKFIKYLRVWDKLNLKNMDPRGILNTNSINCITNTKLQFIN